MPANVSPAWPRLAHWPPTGTAPSRVWLSFHEWRCPRECDAKSRWIKASRLHPMIPRNSERFRKLYRSRSAVERAFGRLKHEWSLLRFRGRGLARDQPHADLTILTKLGSRLAADGAVPHAA